MNDELPDLARRLADYPFHKAAFSLLQATATFNPRAWANIVHELAPLDQAHLLMLCIRVLREATSQARTEQWSWFAFWCVKYNHVTILDMLLEAISQQPATRLQSVPHH